MKFYKSKYIISSGEKIFEDCILVVQDGKVFDIVRNDKVPENTEVIDFGNAVITPGFVNLHTHLQYTDLKPVFKHNLDSCHCERSEAIHLINDDPNMDFSDWIISLMKQYFFWSEAKKIKSFKNGLREAILSGCTCIVQLSREEYFIDILKILDLKSFVFLETFSNSEENSKKEIEKLKKQIKENSSKNVIIGISPHSIYNVHSSLWEEIARFSVEENILVHTHLAESQDETNWLNNKPSGIDKIHKLVKWDNLKPYESGLNPVEYLEKLGFLKLCGENLTAAHCIELDEKSLEKLVNYDAGIAYCPRSNILLHKKNLDYNKLPQSICENTGIGTDSRFSNYDLSILNEARWIKNSTGLDFKKLLDMLTINSARILKIDDKTGSLEKGKDADFLVFNLSPSVILSKAKDLYQDILNKEKPEEIYIKGTQIAKSGKFTAEQWKFLNEPQ
ncbi:MAG TPA: hypothetical protein DDW90_09645 [Cyanobacteria bacterium UBA9971]|nr:hypothetical protein [Cyanobacteria bacterium UBA9971]